jgi:hypothetical protein
MTRCLRAGRAVAPALALFALVACERSTPAASPPTSAPRDWSVTRGQETGAPTPDTPTQRAPNQGGDARTHAADSPARPDQNTTR